ncbi:hypothetical protein Cfor_02243 [Coptotermes formosanus]|uniref:Sodium-coupled monocarboxylate transporter 1 n=1 Tax=Coptotermes formosanus TaxID=36987 RepID=A0A6L2Q8Y4_COPFO|nr:hypothetical protein Cfor_02243 [Coptotermes formosanus]
MVIKDHASLNLEDLDHNITMVNSRAIFFGWLDYGMFGSMFVISTIIGIYFGCFGTRQRTKNEYLLGNKKMSIFPIAMSLTASHISGITLLGAPSEIYTFGTQYWMMCLAACIVCAVVAVAYLPVFYTLQLTSTYEYLELRFDSSVRKFASFMFTIYQVLHIPIVLYVPALAFSQVTGINLHMITPGVSAICIFYTTLGGLKAVVWTDTLQQIIMMGSSIIVVGLGVIAVGGLDVMWQRSLDGDRIEFFKYVVTPSAAISNYRTETKLKEVPRMLETTALEHGPEPSNPKHILDCHNRDDLHMAVPRRGEPGHDAAIPGVAHNLRRKVVSIVTSSLRQHHAVLSQHCPQSPMQGGQYRYQQLKATPCCPLPALPTISDARWSVSLPAA